MDCDRLWRRRKRGCEGAEDPLVSPPLKTLLMFPGTHSYPSPSHSAYDPLRPFPYSPPPPSSTSVPPTPPTRSSLSWVRRFFRWWHCGWRSRDQCGVCERCCVFAYIGGRWRLFCRGGMLSVVRLFGDDRNGPLCGRRSCGGERLARRTTLSRRVHLSRRWYPHTSFDRKPYQNILHCSSTTTGYRHGW